MRVAWACGMMAVMTEDGTKARWVRLATAIRAAREARSLTQVALAELAGISEGTVQNLEDVNRKPPSRMPQSVAKVEPHLGWAAGSGAAILAGGKPTPAPAPSSDSQRGDKLRRKLPLRVVDDLESDDPLLDSQVIRLPGTAGARMTVIVHGPQDATPEQIQEALVAWRRAERNLQRLPDGDDDGDEPQAANGS